MAKAAAKTGMIILGSIGKIVTAAPPKKGGLPERALEGVADLTAIDRVIADLMDAKSVVSQQLRATVQEIFLDDGCGAQKQPGNFTAVETELVNGQILQHSVRAELKKSGSALSEDAQAVAEQYGLPTETSVKAHGTYIVNPALAQNTPVMEAVIAALNAGMAGIQAAMKAEGFAADTPLVQYQEEDSKIVTTEETIPAIFALPRETAETLLPMFSTLSIGWCKHAMLPGREDDLSRPLDRTGRLLGMPTFRQQMKVENEKAKAKADSDKKRKRAA